MSTTPTPPTDRPAPQADHADNIRAYCSKHFGPNITNDIMTPVLALAAERDALAARCGELFAALEESVTASTCEVFPICAACREREAEAARIMHKHSDWFYGDLAAAPDRPTRDGAGEGMR